MAHMMTRMTRWLDSHDSLARWLAVCQDPFSDLRFISKMKLAMRLIYFLWCNKSNGNETSKNNWYPLCNQFQLNKVFPCNFSKHPNYHQFFISIQDAGVSISTDDRRNASATLLREVGYFFLRRRSNLSLNNVMGMQNYNLFTRKCL